MRLEKLFNTENIDNDEINESMMNTITDIFFINPKKDKKIPKKRPVKKLHHEEAAEPFGGVCKFGKTILIPETTLYRRDDTKLIKAAAQMFRGNWVNNKEAQNCLKNVLSHLLRKYLDDYATQGNITSIDMKMMASSVIDGSLNYSSSNDDYKMVKRVFTKIKYHKERIMNDMIDNPGNFEKRWEESKNELATIIENIVKTGGDTNVMMGAAAAKRMDKLKVK